MISSVGLAQIASWAAPVSGFYETAANWDPIGVPAFNDTVVFDRAGSYDIGFLGAVGAANLSVVNEADIDFVVAGAATSPRLLRLSGNASIDEAKLRLLGSVNGPRLSLVLDGDINLLGGTNALQVVNHAAVVNHSTTINLNGTIPVIGDLAQWRMSGDLAVRGSGQLAVTGGGLASSDQTVTLGGTSSSDMSDGFLLVAGTGDDDQPSTFIGGDDLIAGNYGRSQVVVEDGGFADIADRVRVAFGTGSSAAVIVRGVDANGNPATLNTGLITMGSGGDAELLIPNGGVVNSDSATVGDSTDAVVEIRGAAGLSPGTWNVAGALRVGNSGSGRVSVGRGGQVTTNRTFVGLGSGTAVFSIADMDSAWHNTADVYVGGNENQSLGSGVFEVSDDAWAEIGGTLRIWDNATVRVRIDGNMAVDTIDHTHGGLFDLSSGGTLHVNRFEGNLLNPSATLAPGVDGPTGATLITGDYTQQTAGTLALDIGGTSPGSAHDLVTINGQADLDGELELTLVKGYTPNASDEFTVLAADNLFGFFDNVTTGQRLATSDGIGSFVVNYGIGSAFNENRIVLSDFELSGLLPGDYNNDGIVSAADYTVWRDNLGGPAGSLPNDIYGGVIGQAQYDQWKSNFGFTITTATAIPEPTTLLSLIAGGFVILSVYKRNRYLPLCES